MIAIDGGVRISGVEVDEKTATIESLRKRNYRRLNFFGLFLFFSSSLIIFTPFMELFPGVAPNGWEILFWLAWGYAVFAYSIFFLFTANLFKFIEDKKDDSNTSPPVRYWLKNLKIMGISFLIWIASIILLWNSDV